MFDFKIAMDFSQPLADGHVSPRPPPPPSSRRRKTPSPPHSQQHHHHHNHPALRSRPSGNRSPSPTFSIDSLGEQLHPRMSTVSAMSQRTMSPVTPPPAPDADYFAIPMPRRRHDSPVAHPRSDMLPAPLRTSTSSLDALQPPPLHAAGFAPPPSSSPRPSTSSERRPRPPPQHYPSSEDVRSQQQQHRRRRHASGDYPPGVQHQDAEQHRTLGRRAASSERLSPPRTRRQRGPSPLRDHDIDRALPPLPPPSAAVPPPPPPPQHAPPELRLQHANSAPTSALFLPDDVRLPPDLRRASSLRAAASTAQHHHHPADDVDVTDVALFAEALQGLGTMTLDAPFEHDESYSVAAASSIPAPPPSSFTPWAAAPPPAPRAAAPHTTTRAPSPPRYMPPPPATVHAPPPTTVRAPPSNNARAFNAGWAEVELNEAVLGLPDQAGAARPPDDELPDYQTSQREAAERTRAAALTRAQELESRWRGSAPFRPR